MIRAIVIDDEDRSREVIVDKITRYCPQINIVGEADSADSGLEVILDKKPDLVFLDIAMPGKSGFNLLQMLPSLDFEIIFITGYDAYAVEAIRFCAIGYLLKPIQTEELIQAVHHGEKRIKDKQEHNRNRELLQTLLNPGNSENKIGIPTSDGIEFVPVRDIIRCEGVRRCTKVHILNNSPLLSSYNLGEFIRLLSNYSFFSVHKSHLVNLHHIKKLSRGNMVHMTDDSFVPVARRKKKELLERFERL